MIVVVVAAGVTDRVDEYVVIFIYFYRLNMKKINAKYQITLRHDTAVENRREGAAR